MEATGSKLSIKNVLYTEVETHIYTFINYVRTVTIPILMCTHQFLQYFSVVILCRIQIETVLYHVFV